MRCKRTAELNGRAKSARRSPKPLTKHTKLAEVRPVRKAGVLAEVRAGVKPKPNWLRVCMVEVECFDWQWPLSICFRLLPTLRPGWFKKQLRVLA